MHNTDRVKHFKCNGFFYNSAYNNAGQLTYISSTVLLLKPKTFS